MSKSLEPRLSCGAYDPTLYALTEVGGVSQADLAKHLGYHQASISNMYRRVSEYSDNLFDKFEAIAKEVIKSLRAPNRKLSSADKQFNKARADYMEKTLSEARRLRYG